MHSLFPSNNFISMCISVTYTIHWYTEEVYFYLLICVLIMYNSKYIRVLSQVGTVSGYNSGVGSCVNSNYNSGIYLECTEDWYYVFITGVNVYDTDSVLFHFQPLKYRGN